MSSTPTYSTSDLDLAAALVADGFTLRGLRRDERQRTVFTFSDCRELQDARMQFLSGRGDAAKALKAREQLLAAVHGEA